MWHPLARAKLGHPEAAQPKWSKRFEPAHALPACLYRPLHVRALAVPQKGLTTVCIQSCSSHSHQPALDAVRAAVSSGIQYASPGDHVAYS